MATDPNSTVLNLGPTESTGTVILGTYDLGNDGHAILLELLSQKDSTQYSLNDYVFSEPFALMGQDAVVAVERDENNQPITIVRNTRIFLTPKASTGYYGPRVIYYDRVHLSDLGAITLIKGDTTTIYGAITKINQKYGLGITQDDIEDGPLPEANEDGVVGLTLTFKPTSVIFYGSTKIDLRDYQFATGCQCTEELNLINGRVSGLAVTLDETRAAQILNEALITKNSEDIVALQDKLGSDTGSLAETLNNLNNNYIAFKSEVTANQLAVEAAAAKAQTTADNSQIASDRAISIASQAENQARDALDLSSGLTSIANDAVAKAEAAQIMAGAATDAANMVTATAVNALETAQNASETANTTRAVVDDLALQIAAADNTANEAKTTADGLAAQIAELNTAVVGAVSDATEAKTVADSLAELAASARTTAVPAETNANSALEIANAASISAAEATNAVNDAKTEINAAITQIDTINESVNTVLVQVAEAETVANEAKMIAEGQAAAIEASTTASQQANETADAAEALAQEALNVANQNKTALEAAQVSINAINEKSAQIDKASQDASTALGAVHAMGDQFSSIAQSFNTMQATVTNNFDALAETVNNSAGATTDLQNTLQRMPYDVSFSMPIAVDSGETIGVFAVTRNVKFPTNFVGSRAIFTEPPASTSIFTLQSKNTGYVGSVSATPTKVEFFSVGAEREILAGDLLYLVAGDDFDINLKPVSLTFAAFFNAMEAQEQSPNYDFPVVITGPSIIINNVADTDSNAFLNVSGMVTPGSTVVVAWPDESTSNATVNTDGSWTVEATMVIEEGVISAVATDAEGVSSRPVTYTYVKPTARQSQFTGIVEGTDELTASGIASNAAATIKLTWPNSNETTGVVNSTNGVWQTSLTIDPMTFKGNYDYTVVELDSGGVVIATNTYTYSY